jgi:toxin ParE1/3/4
VTLPVVPRQQARTDVDAAIQYFLTTDAIDAGFGFLDALQQAYTTIADHPGLGSRRYAEMLNLPGLRTWRLPGYPYLVFYTEAIDRIDVWRVLHGRRDIPNTFAE